MKMNTEKQFLACAPYFVVRNLRKSLDYYCGVLGFIRPELWGEPPTFAMPHRDGMTFMLYEGDAGTTPIPNLNKGGYWDAYIWVRDLDALFDEFKAAGAAFEYETLVREEYGNKEFAVTDPDGYMIAFGQQID